MYHSSDKLVNGTWMCREINVENSCTDPTSVWLSNLLPIVTCVTPLVKVHDTSTIKVSVVLLFVMPTKVGCHQPKIYCYL